MVYYTANSAHRRRLPVAAGGTPSRWLPHPGRDGQGPRCPALPESGPATCWGSVRKGWKVPISEQSRQRYTTAWWVLHECCCHAHTPSRNRVHLTWPSAPAMRAPQISLMPADSPTSTTSAAALAYVVILRSWSMVKLAVTMIFPQAYFRSSAHDFYVKRRADWTTTRSTVSCTVVLLF